MANILITVCSKYRSSCIHHCDSTRGIGLIPRGVRHGVSQGISTSRINIDPTTHDDRTGQIPVACILCGNARFHPYLARLTRNTSPPEQFQFGTLRIWLDFLEANTEAKVAAAVARGVVVALSRTQGRPVGDSIEFVLPINNDPMITAPGTTPNDPTRARCLSYWVSCWVHHRVAGRIGFTIQVCRPFPSISGHIKEAPRIRRVSAHISGLA